MAAKEQIPRITMQIGEVAKRASLSVDAIRVYERRRLVPNPTRTADNATRTVRSIPDDLWVEVPAAIDIYGPFLQSASR